MLMLICLTLVICEQLTRGGATASTSQEALELLLRESVALLRFRFISGYCFTKIILFWTAPLRKKF